MSNFVSTIRVIWFVVCFQCVAHLSTAFCHVDEEVLEEKIYPALKDPYEIMNLVKTTDPKKLEEMQKR